ncbi:MAG: sulfite exporter TauE/SafE family protein [Kiritimatiellaeota bacterium]|nr:sulfite exporter TauE/SafE family protein [Kiritimatiellota bacterium]
MWQHLGFVVVGLAAGVLSGLFGIGGGLLIIPVLVYFFGMSQHLAQGTTLALMIPPIGIFAAWAYWKQGNVHLVAAAFICLGFVIGGWIGAKFAHALPELLLRRSFGVLLAVVAAKMMLGK